MAVYTPIVITSVGGEQVSVSSADYSYSYFLNTQLGRVILMKTISIDALEQSQLTEVLRFEDKDADGNGKYSVSVPHMYMDQSQFMIKDLELKFPFQFNGINDITYTIKAGKWVRLTFNTLVLDKGESIHEMPDGMVRKYRNPRISKLEQRMKPKEEFLEPEEVEIDNKLKKENEN